MFELIYLLLAFLCITIGSAGLSAAFSLPLQTPLRFAVAASSILFIITGAFLLGSLIGQAVIQLIALYFLADAPILPL